MTGSTHQSEGRVDAQGGLTRREFMIGGVVAGALVLVGCAPSSSRSGDPSGASTSPTGPWSFVDDRPIKVEADAVPQRIVAYETAAAALLGFGIDSLVAVFGSAPLDKNPYLKGLDLTGIEDVGSVYGEVNFEKIAALAPDLIVTTAYIDTRTGADAAATQLGGIQGAHARQVLTAIAPVVGIDELLPASKFIARFEDLAASLGADVDGGTLLADRQRYEQSTQAFRSALADNPGLSFLAVSATADALYVAQPADFQDLPEFQDLGMDLIEPDSTDQYFETLSWENADKYPADILLVDSRPGSPPESDIAGFSPTWETLPAVKAHQTFPWVPYVSTSTYASYAAQYEALTELIDKAKDVA